MSRRDDAEGLVQLRVLYSSIAKSGYRETLPETLPGPRRRRSELGSNPTSAAGRRVFKLLDLQFAAANCESLA